MPVIIHEFEADVRPDPEPAGDHSPATSAKPQRLGAHEIQQIVRRNAERAARLSAD